MTRPWQRRSQISHQSIDMTKAEATEIQLRWTQQVDPPLCEHLKVELEGTEGREVSGTYRRTACVGLVGLAWWRQKRLASPPVRFLEVEGRHQHQECWPIR
jgi:hypothetical protein